MHSRIASWVQRLQLRSRHLIIRRNAEPRHRMTATTRTVRICIRRHNARMLQSIRDRPRKLVRRTEPTKVLVDTITNDLENERAVTRQSARNNIPQGKPKNVIMEVPVCHVSTAFRAKRVEHSSSPVNAVLLRHAQSTSFGGPIGPTIIPERDNHMNNAPIAHSARLSDKASSRPHPPSYTLGERRSPLAVAGRALTHHARRTRDESVSAGPANERPGSSTAGPRLAMTGQSIFRLGLAETGVVLFA